MPRRPLPGSREWRERRRSEKASRWIWTVVGLILLLVAAGLLMVARPGS